MGVSLSQKVAEILASNWVKLAGLLTCTWFWGEGFATATLITYFFWSLSRLWRYASGHFSFGRAICDQAKAKLLGWCLEMCSSISTTLCCHPQASQLHWCSFLQKVLMQTVVSFYGGFGAVGSSLLNNLSGYVYIELFHKVQKQNASPSWAVWSLGVPMVFIFVYFCLYW